MARIVPVSIIAVAVLAASCHRPPGTAQDAFRGIDCSTVEPSMEPTIIAWDAASRASLDRLRRQGVVPVRYEKTGCEVSLELIPSCVGPKDRYVYSRSASSTSRVARDAKELLAQLPLGAASLVPILEDKPALRTDIRQVGTVALPPGTVITEYDLVGPDCRRATHVVSGLHVGGFAIVSGDVAVMMANDKPFANPTGPGESVVREGQSTACERALTDGRELGGCSVPVRLVLSPLKEPSAGQVAKADAGGPPTAKASTPVGDVFDQRALERIVREHQGALKRRCWDTAPDNIRRVSISVTTTVDASGNVVEASPQLTNVDGSADVAASVGRCVGEDVQKWRFPEPGSRKVITLPFHLMRQ